MRINFTVRGEPKGKGRPRFSRVGNYARTYTPEETVKYEDLVKSEYLKQCGRVKFEKGIPLSLNISAYYTIPKSASMKRKRLMAEGEIRPTKKPDVDNVVKIIADSLNGIAYHDDAQIVDAEIHKFYSEIPRVEVEIQEEMEA